MEQYKSNSITLEKREGVSYDDFIKQMSENFKIMVGTISSLDTLVRVYSNKQRITKENVIEEAIKKLQSSRKNVKKYFELLMDEIVKFPDEVVVFIKKDEEILLNWIDEIIQRGQLQCT